MNEKLKSSVKKILPENVVRSLSDARNQVRIWLYANQKTQPFHKESFPAGINLIGSFSEDSGLGQSCRLLAREIEGSGIPHTFIDFNVFGNVSSTNHEFEDKFSKEFTYGINVFHINMGDFLRLFQTIDHENWDSHYNIAFWLWENEDFPKEWIPFIKRLDEIWTPAEFVSDSIRNVTDKPVRTIPYTVDAPYDPSLNRASFGLPEDRFLFLMMFDTNSNAERKNPFGVIEAFQTAFDKNDKKVGLVIKIGNASDAVRKKLQEKLNGYDIYFVEGILPKESVNSLIHCCNVYVSLHRAEGYGLVLAEAMRLGVPTIATGYSANTEFQDSDTACLTHYGMRRIGQDLPPYKKEYLWADPDLDEAAEYMRKLLNDTEFYQRIQSNALNYMNAEERKSIPMNRLISYVKEIYENS